MRLGDNKFGIFGSASKCRELGAREPVSRVWHAKIRQNGNLNLNKVGLVLSVTAKLSDGAITMYAKGSASVPRLLVL